MRIDGLLGDQIIFDVACRNKEWSICIKRQNKTILKAKVDCNWLRTVAIRIKMSSRELIWILLESSSAGIQIGVLCLLISGDLNFRLIRCEVKCQRKKVATSKRGYCNKICYYSGSLCNWTLMNIWTDLFMSNWNKIIVDPDLIKIGSIYVCLIGCHICIHVCLYLAGGK